MHTGTMLANALSPLEAEVTPIKLWVAPLQPILHPQNLQVVLKPPVVGHAGIERILPGMPKRRMPQVVCQRDGLHQIFIDAQRSRYGPPKLRHPQRMC